MIRSSPKICEGSSGGTRSRVLMIEILHLTESVE